MPLSSTRQITGNLYCTAVENSWPLIRKSPSPLIATTLRFGYRRFIATAAGTP